MGFLDQVFTDTQQQSLPKKSGGFLDSVFGGPDKAAGDSLVQHGMESLRQREQDIDYDSGAPISTRVMVQRADNPNEAKKVLEKSYGQGNFGQDRFGQWWVKQGDKRVSVLPKGVSGAFKNFGTGMLASATPTMGALAGGAIGEAFFPFGGGIPGAAIGAMAGKGLDDLMKWAQGVFSQTVPEVVSSMSTEGTLAAGFQGAGPLMKQAGQGVRSGLQSFVGTTPTTRTLATELSGSGAKPPVGSFAPAATSVEYKRQLRNMLGGNPAEAANIQYLDQRMRSVLANEGIQPAEIDQIMNEVKNTSFKQSAAEAGAAVTEKAKAIHTDLLNDYVRNRDAAQTIVQNTDKVLRAMASPNNTLGQDIAEAITTQRRDFGKQMAGVYKSIDRMTGDQAVVPTDLIRAQAAQLVKVFPPQALPPLIKDWAGKQAPKMITFEQAHALRTVLRDIAEMVDVSPTGHKLGNVAKMAGAVNTSINSTSDVVGKQAAVLLKQADKQYADGIAKFNNHQINSIVRQLRTGIIPEPETVAKTIMDPGNVHLAKTVLGMLPENVKTNVIKADLKNMINAATYRTDEGKLLMDGKSFLKALDERKKLIEQTYPQGILKGLYEHATNLAAFDGQLDVNALKTPTAVTHALQNATGAMRAAEEFAKNNPLGALVSGTPMQIDRALAHISRAGNETVTEQAAKTLGVNSPQWRSVRKYALQRLFAGATEETRSLAKTVSGTAIDKELNRYTRKQQELLFPNGLADDLRTLSKEAKFLFPESHAGDMGTSMAAASIKGHLWLNPLAVWKYIRLNVMGYVADHPRLLRFLAGEIKRDPVHARGVMSAMGQWMMDRAIEGGPGKGRPGPDIEPEKDTARAPPKPPPPQFAGPLQ